MEFFKLSAHPRTLQGRKNYHLRNEGTIPAVVYGAALSGPESITVDRALLGRLYKEAGESSLIELQIEGKKDPYNVLIQELQFDPLRSELIHADFRAVDMNKPIEAEVKLRFVGEAPAIKALGGTLVTPVETVSVRALPRALVSHLDVMLSSLVTFEDDIHLKDIILPPGIELLDDVNATVATVAPPRSDEELAALEGTVVEDVTAVEVAAKKLADAEAAEGEGETAPAKDGAKEAPKKEAKKDAK